MIIILRRRAAQSIVKITGILWTTKRKKLIDPDSVTNGQKLKSKREIIRIIQKDSKPIEPKVTIEVLLCIMTPNALGSFFGYIWFFG